MEATKGCVLKYLLDTNVVSQTSKLKPHVGVMEWWQQQDELSLVLSAIVFQELRFGIDMVQPGRRRNDLEEWLERRLRPAFVGRILPVTEKIAELSGQLLAETKQKGHMAEVADTLIAATARVHGMAVATLNHKHFEWLGVELVEF